MVRGYLLLIKLPYAVEHFEKEIALLSVRLPPGSKRVLYANEVMGWLIPHETIAEITAIHLGDVMKAFSDWWLIGLDGQLVSKNGSMDPFRHWMNERGGGGVKGILKPQKTQHVPLTERRKPRGKGAVGDLIDGATGEVGLKPPPDKDRS